MPRVWGARLPDAALGVELAATPADGCTALAAKLKSVAGELPTDPKPDAAGTSVGAPTSADTPEPDASAVEGAAPALVCTWSGVTGCRGGSRPLGGGGPGAPRRLGTTAAPVPGTSGTSSLPSLTTPPRSKE